MKPIIPVMRTALEQIQEMHAKTYWTAQDEVWDLNAKCNECHAVYPCDTRKLADEGLATVWHAPTKEKTNE